MGGRADTPTTFQECKITFFPTIVLFRLLESQIVVIVVSSVYLFAISRFNKT